MTMTLAQAHADLKAALHPLGIEIGPEVLALWRDQQIHGGDPLPRETLRRLAAVAGRLAREPER